MYAFSLLAAIVIVWVLSIVGWFSNLFWVLANSPIEGHAEFWVALLGLIAAPLGVVHGLYVLF